jgi:hypothetical protein
MRERQLKARRAPKEQLQREQEQQAWKDGHAERKRIGYAFVGMGCYLRASERRLKLERYVTALYGCKTSWARIEECGKYFSYRKRERRSERPANGGKWDFNPRTRGPLRAPLAA